MLKTTDTGVSGQQYYGAWLSLNVAKNHVHRNFAEQKPIVPNSGKKVVMRYYDNLPVADTPLVEGVTPTGSDPVLHEVEIAVASYGDYIDVSDEVGLFDRDGNVLVNPNSAQNVELVGEQANDTLDTLARDQMFKGSGVFYAGAPSVDSRNEIALANKVSVDDFRMIVRTLMLNKVKPLTTMIQASVGQQTSPLPPSYIGFVGAMTLHDLTQLTGWIGVHKYANPGAALPDEIGALTDLDGRAIRFIYSENDKVFAGAGAGGIDVYATLVFGREFYGETKLSGRNLINFIPKPFGSAGTEDPLNQKATFGWKVEAYGCGILKQTAGIRYEHAVTE